MYASLIMNVYKIKEFDGTFLEYFTILQVYLKIILHFIVFNFVRLLMILPYKIWTTISGVFRGKYLVLWYISSRIRDMNQQNSLISNWYPVHDASLDFINIIFL